LPLMADPEWRATMDVLIAALPPALFTDANLLCLVIYRMANLSLAHGNSDAACVAYVSLGMLLGPHFGNYRAGFSFGKLGLDLVDLRGLRRFESRVCVMFGGRVSPWTQQVRTGLGLVWRAFDAASRQGDLTYAGLIRNVLIINLLFAGGPLGDVQREAEAGLEFARQFGFGHIIDYMTVNLGLIRTLRGLNPEFGSFNGAGFDEGLFEQRLAKDPALSAAARWYWICQLKAGFFAGSYVRAAAAAANVQSLLSTPGSLEVAEYQVYAALVQAALCDTASVAERAQHQAALAAHHRQLQEWAENCPANFEGPAALIGAEIARIEGRTLEAEEFYEQAIRSARANSFVHNEAVANELAARFYAARRFETTSHAYLREARYCYLRWGADGKVKQLDRLHPRLKDESPVPGPTSTIGAPAEQLDLDTVIKVSQTVSGEMILDRLLERLMRAAIEHAGAGRGLLIVPRGDELKVEAEATVGGDDVTVHLRDGTHAPAALPESVVRYVMRTRETVILDDASSQNPFSADPYIVQRRARSILSLPLIHRGTLIGILYLENNLTPRVFTPDRVTVLKVLASQAAVSLQNTWLYRDLADREGKIRRLVDADIIGIFIWDFDGRILEANDAFLGMIGYDRDDLAKGRIRWRDLTPPEWREPDAQMVREHKMAGRVGPFEKEYFHKDGSRVPVLLGAATFEEGGSQGVAFVLDLTERKRSEEALLRAREELARVTRVSTVGELAASIAHEINQPLAAVTTYAGAAQLWLRRDPPNLEMAREALQHTIQQGEHAGAIVARVRALVQKAPPRTEAVDIDKVILEVLDLSRNKLQRNGVSIRTQLAAGKPLVRGDRIQLQQVVLNLILNAVDAMSEPGTSPRELSIASRREEANQVLVEVRDSGRGFQGETMERIFEPFFTTKIDGMGMGLSISRSIVVAHGGRLWAMANEPRGAVFRFALPAVEPEVPFEGMRHLATTAGN
jgi:PAS domain S-box-containing protein